MKVLVTGAGGFVGHHLVNKLIERGHYVVPCVHNNKGNYIIPVNVINLDISNTDEIQRVLEITKPDAVIHLAAQSSVPVSWDNPALTFQINTIGTVNLLQKIGEFNPEIKFIYVGSSEEYGLSAKTHSLLVEETECIPQNPYAISKLSAGQAVIQLSKKYNINSLHARPFNHFGPGQKQGFVISDFASQIIEIERGLREPKIHVGDISTYRDFTDVRDVINAYILLLENKVDNGIYNISSGNAREINTLLNQLISLAQLDVEVITDPNKFRASEVKKFAGDYTKIKKAVGWNVEYSIEISLRDTLDWWRNQIN
jgi:GDP-4-dehydro-6-deoxy-D-mannose reductase